MTAHIDEATNKTTNNNVGYLRELRKATWCRQDSLSGLPQPRRA